MPLFNHSKVYKDMWHVFLWKRILLVVPLLINVISALILLAFHQSGGSIGAKCQCHLLCGHFTPSHRMFAKHPSATQPPVHRSLRA